MKLESRQVTSFLRNPGQARVVLLHGDDEGLIQERATALARQVAGRSDDPFLVVELTREGWSKIPAEMAALSMIGGRRVILVRDATDAVLGAVVEALKGPGESLLILQAVGLRRGKLRSLAEGSKEAVSIGCYPAEGPALQAFITETFASLQVSAESEAVVWLSQQLGVDRALTRRELEKVALMAEIGGEVTLDMAQSCTGEMAAATGDEGIVAATLGDIVLCDTAVAAALADGLSGVALLRMATSHLQKLHQAALRMQAGASIAEAVKAMRPPVFYSGVGQMTKALGMWPVDTLLRAIEEARRVELACKQTGSRPELLARRFIQSLARSVIARRA